MKEQGFTLMEVVVVIAIVGILTTFVFWSFSGLSSRKVLEGAADDIVSALSEARSLTLASSGGDRYGIDFQASQFVRFKGSTYVPGASTNVVTALNPAVGVRNISLSGGTSVVFDRLTGATSNSGTLEVYLLSATTTSLRITVSATGLAEIK